MKNNNRRTADSALRTLLVAAGVALAGNVAAAGNAPSSNAAMTTDSAIAQNPSGLEFSGSGFLSAVAGKVLGGSHDPATDRGYNCPCFISDYGQGGVYESGRTRVGPDSRLGFQGTVTTADRRMAFTAQVVSRGTANGAPNLEWAYGTFELNSKLTLQLGRKRLPLFAYSEVQDVGFAVPWTHLPPQLYGWEVVNYNGANLQYRDTWGDWATSVNTFAGTETAPKSGYWRIYNGKDTVTDTRWSNILGTELKASRGNFDARYVYLQSYTQNRITSDGETAWSDRLRQRIHGLSFSYELGSWITKAEFLAIERTEDYGRDHAQLYALGYRMGRFTPMVSYSNYRQTNKDPSVAEAHDTHSVVLRYDLTNTSAIKVQYDLWRDFSAPGFDSMHGNSRLLTVGYDLVF